MAISTHAVIELSMDRFGLYADELMGDSAFESAEMLARLVYEHGIEPHIPVFDKSRRQDGTFRRSDFVYDRKVDASICPAGKLLKQSLAVKVKSSVVEAPQWGILTPPPLCVDSHKSLRPGRNCARRVAIEQFSGASLNDISKEVNHWGHK